MSDIKTIFFQTVSNCCHPMAMLTYGITFICFFTPMLILPLGIRLFMMLEVMFYTFVIPLLTIWLLYKLKVVSHWALRKREDRKIPLIANLLCYFACTFTVLYHGFVPTWGMCVFYGSTAVAIVSWIISFWWKISGHALAISGLTSLCGSTISCSLASCRFGCLSSASFSPDSSVASASISAAIPSDRSMLVRLWVSL